jgi:DNA repair protein RAD50
MLGTSTIYESLLRVGKQKKLCTACNRHLDDHEMIVFEKYVCHSKYFFHFLTLTHQLDYTL